MLTKRQHIRKVTAGAVYERLASGSLHERAEVLDVTADEFGIPHVRFCLEVRRGPELHTRDSRTLSLDSFADRFHERVMA